MTSTCERNLSSQLKTHENCFTLHEIMPNMYAAELAAPAQKRRYPLSSCSTFRSHIQGSSDMSTYRVFFVVVYLYIDRNEHT